MEEANYLYYIKINENQWTYRHHLRINNNVVSVRNIDGAWDLHSMF